MELGLYGIIKKVIVTPKSWKTFQKLGKITFEVSSSANRIMVREAVEKIWDVKVKKICILNGPTKTGVFARRRFTKAGKKRAIITLKEGYKIDLPGEGMSMAGQPKAQAQSAYNGGKE